MKAFFSYLLLALVLLQTLSREVLLVDFTLHQPALAARYCINKARPELHCDGKCYFAKLAKKQQQRESKAPNAAREKLEMLSPALRSLVPPAPRSWAAAPAGYGPYVATALPRHAQCGVFRPPQV